MLRFKCVVAASLKKDMQSSRAFRVRPPSIIVFQRDIFFLSCRQARIDRKTRKELQKLRPKPRLKSFAACRQGAAVAALILLQEAAAAKAARCSQGQARAACTTMQTPTVLQAV